MKHATLSFRIWLRAEVIYLAASIPLLLMNAEMYIVSAALAVAFGLLNLVIFIFAMSIQEVNVSPKPGRAMAAVYACALIGNLPGLALACRLFDAEIRQMWPLPLLALVCGLVSVASYRRALHRYFHGVLSHSI